MYIIIQAIYPLTSLKYLFLNITFKKMGYTVEFHIVRKSQSYTKWADEQLILDSFLVHRERERDREI